MNKTGNFSKVQRMVILAVLIALTLVMALSAHSLVSQALYNALVWTHSARQCFQSTGFTPL